MINKNKIIDTNTLEKDFKYTKIVCKGGNCLDCSRCDCNERESSLKQFIHNNDDNMKTIIEDYDEEGVVIGTHEGSLDKVKVIRGKYDDVIGWEIIWQ